MNDIKYFFFDIMNNIDYENIFKIEENSSNKYILKLGNFKYSYKYRVFLIFILKIEGESCI